MFNKVFRFSKLFCVLSVSLIALSVCGSFPSSVETEPQAAVYDTVANCAQEADDIQLGASRKPRVKPVKERLAPQVKKPRMNPVRERLAKKRTIPEWIRC